MYRVARKPLCIGNSPGSLPVGFSPGLAHHPRLDYGKAWGRQ
ncbi:MAG: hypothetical protein [Olavius algarvensis Gamma 1 endosymbiont]|nr:MAG: hypothetical protein [Olavius algarvensis Gamma 1 endosymbiont]